MLEHLALSEGGGGGTGVWSIRAHKAKDAKYVFLSLRTAGWQDISHVFTSVCKESLHISEQGNWQVGLLVFLKIGETSEFLLPSAQFFLPDNFLNLLRSFLLALIPPHLKIWVLQPSAFRG